MSRKIDLLRDRKRIILPPIKQLVVPDAIRARYIALWSQYVNYPVDFTNDFIFKDTGYELSWQQIDLLKAIAEFDRVACKAATGVGKSSSLSCAIQWFLCTRPQPYIPCTAPTLPQLKDVLWTEIARWLSRSNLRNIISWSAEKIYLKSDPLTSYAVGRTAREAQSLAGRHAHSMMFVADEASVIRDDIFEVIEGCLTHEGNKFVMIGNPTQISGYFYDAFHDDAEDWKKLTFSGEDSPLVTAASLARLARKYGKDSDIYRVRGLGEFPKGNPNSFFQLQDVEAAMLREVDIIKGAPFELGVDVARGGNNLTTVAIRQGNKGDFDIESESKSTITSVARLVIQVVRKYRELLGYEGVVKVKIDDTGLGGGVTDILKEDTDNNILPIPCLFGMVGEIKSPVYADKASEMWGELRDQLPYISLPNHGRLREELSTRKVSYLTGRTKIQSKDDFKAEYGDSPDFADCTVMAFAKSVEKKKVLSFSKFNSKQMRDYKINWKVMLTRNTTLYASVWYDSDLLTTITLSLWDAFDGKLYVFDELSARDSRPENLLPRLMSKVKEHIKMYPAVKINLNTFQWYCNKEMCGITGTSRNAFKTSRDGADMQWSAAPYGVGLMPNLSFDLDGSIAIASSMFVKGMITVHSRCHETIRQMSDWSIDNNGRPSKDNIGNAMSVCNIVSHLHESGHSRKFLPKLIPYTEASQKAHDYISKLDRDGTIFAHAGRLLVAGQRKVR